MSTIPHIHTQLPHRQPVMPVKWNFSKHSEPMRLGWASLATIFHVLHAGTREIEDLESSIFSDFLDSVLCSSFLGLF